VTATCTEQLTMAEQATSVPFSGYTRESADSQVWFS